VSLHGKAALFLRFTCAFSSPVRRLRRTALCRELLARGHPVRAVVRRRIPPGGPAPVGSDPHPGYRCRIRSQRARRRRWNDRPPCRDRPPIEPNEAEIRRVNCDSAVQLAEAAAGIVRRFIFLSSVKVHGEDSGSGAYVKTTRSIRGLLCSL